MYDYIQYSCDRWDLTVQVAPGRCDMSAVMFSSYRVKFTDMNLVKHVRLLI